MVETSDTTQLAEVIDDEADVGDAFDEGTLTELLADGIAEHQPAAPDSDELGVPDVIDADDDEAPAG